MNMPESESASPISEDTIGSAPGSPVDESLVDKRVQVCCWAGCNRELSDLSLLVAHLHDDHFGVRKSKYACQWDDCSRKGMAQPSRFALVSHMRSHTGEKPFFCLIPECDRSFTRSDALAKHMRTVHEIETLAPEKKASVTSLDNLVCGFDALNPFDACLGLPLDTSDHELYQALSRRLIWSQVLQDSLDSELQQVKRLERSVYLEKELLLHQLYEKGLSYETKDNPTNHPLSEHTCTQSM